MFEMPVKEGIKLSSYKRKKDWIDQKRKIK
jgi:hypothetical protein